MKRMKKMRPIKIKIVTTRMMPFSERANLANMAMHIGKHTKALMVSLAVGGFGVKWK